MYIFPQIQNTIERIRIKPFFINRKKIFWSQKKTEGSLNF